MKNTRIQRKLKHKRFSFQKIAKIQIRPSCIHMMKYCFSLIIKQILVSKIAKYESQWKCTMQKREKCLRLPPLINTFLSRYNQCCTVLTSDQHKLFCVRLFRAVGKFQYPPQPDGGHDVIDNFEFPCNSMKNIISIGNFTNTVMHEECKIIWKFQIRWGGTSLLKPLRRYLRYFRGTHCQSSLSRRLLAFYTWMNHWVPVRSIV